MSVWIPPRSVINYFDTIKWQQFQKTETLVQLYYPSFYLISLWTALLPNSVQESFSPVGSFASSLNPPACPLFQLLYLCHMLKSIGREVGETVQLLFPVFTVRFFFFTPILLISVLISTKSNFILLRFYGENVLYKLNESMGCFWANSGYLLEV